MARRQPHIVLRDTESTTTASPFDVGVRAGTAARPSASPHFGEPKIEVADMSAGDVAVLGRDREVVSIAPVMPTRLIEPVAAPLVATTAWGVAAVRADVSVFTGAGVKVALLDTGIDGAHPAFAGAVLTQEDFTGSGNGDGNGHGTHCAGTIFGRDVSGQRIGIARGVTATLIGKVLGNDGRGNSDMLFRAIQWATNNSAQVISMSLGFDFPGLVDFLVTHEGWPVTVATSAGLEAYRANLRMFDALMSMVRARAAFGPSPVVVAAAGNESDRGRNPDFEVAASLPAAAEGVISVGALAQGANGFTIAPFSNTLPQVSGPGVGILSAALAGGLRTLSGTSMACPHVAGVAALWWEALAAASVPLTANAVVARLLATARVNELDPGVEVADRGAGLVTAP